MNFAKLFGAGKNMIGMKDQPSPYRMRTENLLPKFESTKNPFATKTKAVAAKTQPMKFVQAAPVSAPVISQAVVKPALMETPPLFGPDLKPAPMSAPVVEVVAAPVVIPAALAISVVAEKTETPEAAEVKVAEAVVAPAAVAAAAPTYGTNVSHGANGMAATKTTAPKPQIFSGWLKKLNPLGYLPEPSRNQPKTGRKPVQAELSLERIKVVRNDLHEDDVEIVLPKTTVKTVSAPSRLQSVVKTEATALSRMTAKFFGAEETQVR